MKRVGIGHDFFARGLNDYADWQWAWVRELVQNGCDAGARNIHFTLFSGPSTMDGSRYITAICENDGPPMDYETVTDKFLCLGGTTKRDDVGQTGGFGIAKVVIALAHRSFMIETGDLLVGGAGGEFDVTKSGQTLDGVRTTIVMDTDLHELARKIRTFAAFMQWDGTLKLSILDDDGQLAQPTEVLCTSLRKGSPRRELEFGKVYSNKSFQHCMVVRVNGIPMFMQRIDLDRCIVVELAGKSDTVLTSNRDGLVSPYSWQLSSFVTELAVDKQSALRPRQSTRKRYRGRKLFHSIDVANSEGEQQLDVTQIVAAHHEMPADGVRRMAGADAADVPTQGMGTCTNMLGHEFILKNETDLKIPAYYDPGSGEFSTYSTKLVRAWGRLMVQMHRTLDVAGSFSVGFIFDEDTVAEYEQDGDCGVVYYINPCKMVEQVASRSKSFKRRWSFSHADKKMLLSVAAHEFVHGVYERSIHDELFANKYTEVVGRVLANANDFNWCYK